jgi:hypothetical protein
MGKKEKPEFNEIKPPYTIRQTLFARIFAPICLAALSVPVIFEFFKNGGKDGYLLPFFSFMALIIYM